MQAYRLAFTEPMGLRLSYGEKPAMVSDTITKPSAANISHHRGFGYGHGWEIKVKSNATDCHSPCKGSVGYHIFF